MRSRLVFRSPQHGAGWEDSWAFSGRDESVLRGCLGRIEAHSTPAPVERWDSKRLQRVIEAGDRWLAAMLLFADEVYDKRFDPVESVIHAEAAWTAEGARQLAQMLPDELGDLRASIEQRFGSTGD